MPSPPSRWDQPTKPLSRLATAGIYALFIGAFAAGWFGRDFPEAIALFWVIMVIVVGLILVALWAMWTGRKFGRVWLEYGSPSAPPLWRKDVKVRRRRKRRR